jgi:hypothetical protein
MMKRSEIPELQAGDILVERGGHQHHVQKSLYVVLPLTGMNICIDLYWTPELTHQPDKPEKDIVKIIRATETIWYD